MDMRMESEVTPPGVQHGGDAEQAPATAIDSSDAPLTPSPNAAAAGDDAPCGLPRGSRATAFVALWVLGLAVATRRRLRCEPEP
jgi:hypothetical protein